MQSQQGVRASQDYALGCSLQTQNTLQAECDWPPPTVLCVLAVHFASSRMLADARVWTCSPPLGACSCRSWLPVQVGNRSINTYTQYT